MPSILESLLCYTSSCLEKRHHLDWNHWLQYTMQFAYFLQVMLFMESFVTSWNIPETLHVIQLILVKMESTWLGSFGYFWLKSFGNLQTLGSLSLENHFVKSLFFLFHHSSITFVIGSIVVYDPSGNMYLPVVLNAFVHVLMYSHYLVTVLGMKSWWRHYLTSLQLIQFMIITTQSIVAYIHGPSCGLDFEKVLLTVYMGSMLILFGNFFVRQYIVKEPPTGTSNGHEVKKTK